MEGKDLERKLVRHMHAHIYYSSIKRNVKCPTCDADLERNCHDSGRILKKGVHTERIVLDKKFREMRFDMFQLTLEEEL